MRSILISDEQGNALLRQHKTYWVKRKKLKRPNYSWYSLSFFLLCFLKIEYVYGKSDVRMCDMIHDLINKINHYTLEFSFNIYIFFVHSYERMNEKNVCRQRYIAACSDIYVNWYEYEEFYRFMFSECCSLVRWIRMDFFSENKK